MDVAKAVGIVVEATGRLRFIWDDTLAGIAELGETEVRRASHVEPTGGNRWTGWNADLAPVGGPSLGPFATHGAAIRAEREWLTANGW